MAAGKGGAKAPSITVPSDDFEIAVDPQNPNGDQWSPHAGQWVKVSPYRSVGEMQMDMDEADLQVQLEALEPAEGATEAEVKAASTQATTTINAYYELVYERFDERIFDWSWTDAKGRPLPKPSGGIDVYRRLNGFEVGYLLGVLARSNPAQRGNGSAPSETSSSDTQPTETPKPARARSRGKPD